MSFEVISRSDQARVASFQTDPYEYEANADAGDAVKAVLEDAAELDQMNRTRFDGDESFPGDDPDSEDPTSETGGTSMEGPQDPSADFRRSYIVEHLRTGYIILDAEASIERVEADAKFTEGDKVMLGDERAIVVEIWTSGEREGPDGEEYEASEDDPVYIVATEDGAEAATEDDLTADDWSTGRDDPDEELGEHLAASRVMARVMDDGSVEHVTVQAGPTDWDYPESWKEADTPARLILLDAWSSMGGQFDCGGDCCKGTMTKAGMSDRASDQFCAAMKDRVLMWEGWRRGGS